MMSLADRYVGIYSPLHSVSQHFVDRLGEGLDDAAIPHRRLPSRNGEVGSSKTAKARALAAHVANARRHLRDESTTVVAWPLLGWWEMPLWRGPHRTFITMHDPEPLVATNGISPAAARRAARLTGLGWPRIVTLSPEATDVVHKYFDPAQVDEVPHPMRPPSNTQTDGKRRRVLVLGQFKAARDLDVMAQIGPSMRAAGWEPTVAGRGWPAIPGWNVIDRFLPEDEFDTLLRTSAAVLIPYRYYFQSGVALRALESGTPVVGRPTGFLTSILGDDFPGTVSEWSRPAAWIEAVEQASAKRECQLTLAAEYAHRGQRAWADLITGGNRGPAGHQARG